MRFMFVIRFPISVSELARLQHQTRRRPECSTPLSGLRAGRKVVGFGGNTSPCSAVVTQSPGQPVLGGTVTALIHLVGGAVGALGEFEQLRVLDHALLEAEKTEPD